MSYNYRGRYTHNYQEFLRWKSEGEREDLRRANSNLKGEADRLRSELGTARGDVARAQGDVREVARLQARLEQRQREHEEVQRRIQDSQRQYEERAQRRQRELEQEIGEVDERAREQVEQLRRETSDGIDAVRGEVEDLRGEVGEGLAEVRAEVEETRARLQEQMSSVRADLERERQRRVAREQGRAAQAARTIEWVEGRMSDLKDLDALGLHVERTRTEEYLARAREVVRGDDPEMAAPLAETAFAAFQTTYLEAEHRLGTIAGVAEHARDLAGALEKIAATENLRLVFKVEAAQLDAAAAALRARADDWVARKQWTVFEVEREKLIPRANEMLARALELQAIVPGLVRQLREREQRLKEAGAAIASVTGAVDRFETGYANADDVKSPRLLRGHVGNACVDAYLDLDGTYRVDAYGFTTSGQCGEAAARMGRKLEEVWHVTEASVDPHNRQERSVVPAAGEEPWHRTAEDFSSVSEKFKRASGQH